MSVPKIGWWILLASLGLNTILGGMIYFQHHQKTRDQIAYIVALERCQARLEKYAEVKAVADAFEKMIEEKATGD